jgi:tetratricopeptide (TPR) repeat protein
MSVVTSAARKPGGLVFALSLIAVASAGCSELGPTKEQLLASANEHFAAEQYDKAEKDYREVLRLAPDDPIAVRKLGIIYHGQGQLPQAYPLLKKAAELHPNDLEVQIELGQSSLMMRELQPARDTALAILDKQPGDEQALVLLANTAIAPTDIEETRKLIEDLRQQDRNRPGYHLAIGTLDLRQTDLARAESEFKAALDLDPRSRAALAALGVVYESQNDLKAADKAFKQAADLSPLRSPMRLHYAGFKLRTGALDEARTILGEITAKYPDYLPARVYSMRIACSEHQDSEHQDDDCAAQVKDILARDPISYDALFQDGLVNLAKGNAATGDVTKAVREFEYLNDTYTPNPQVLYQLARSYLAFAKNTTLAVSRDAFETADTRVTEAVQIDPYFEPAVLLYGELKIRKGSAAAASDALTELIKARPQSTAQAYLMLASAYLVLQRQDQALRVYRQMTELFPQNPQPQFLIGSILLAQNQHAQARKEFEKSAEIAPDYLPPVEQLVELDIADRQYTAALDRVQKHIDKDPKTAQAWALRGKIYMAQRDFARAEQDLLKAIEIDPQLEPAYLLLARYYVAANKQHEAIAKLQAFVQQRKDVAALMQLATIQEQLKNYPAARDAYEQLLTVAANNFPTLNNLAVLYSDHFGQLDKAYDLAKKAREAAPSDPHSADTLGWILVKKGEYGSARPLLQESAVKQSGEPEVQFHLGIALYMLGEEGAARVALQKAVDANEVFPGKDEARARLALLLIDVEKAGAAVRTKLENYLRDRPNDPGALARLATLQERDGDEDRAIRTYEKLLAEDPFHAPALRELALLYGQNLKDDSNPADISKAYDLGTKARQTYPNDAEVARALGILSYRQGSYLKSIELLNDVAGKRNDDSVALFYLGEAFRQMKQWKDCTATLGRALDLKSLPEPLAEQAKRSLADCS